MVFVFNLISFFNYPSLKDLKTHYKEFNNLHAQSVEIITIDTYILNSKPVKIENIITTDSIINKIIASLKTNKSEMISFKDWNPVHGYKLNIITKNKELFVFDVIQTDSNFNVVNLIYNKGELVQQIGQYLNRNIQFLKNL